jgi:hypothetical protein
MDTNSHKFSDCDGSYKSVKTVNGADGVSDIEGKVARVAASECGQRASFNDEIRKRKTPNVQPKEFASRQSNGE